MGFSRQKVRPAHPQKRRRSAAALQKKGLRAALKAAAQAHPDKRLELCGSRTRQSVGNKGRVCHRRWRRGRRAPGPRQIGDPWADIFTAVCPATGEDVTRVLPTVNAKVMDPFRARCAATRPDDAPAVIVRDRAGWHDRRALEVPDTLTPAPLPSDSPELNPVERLWLYLRERVLSLRASSTTPQAIIEACCQAWNALTEEPDRIRSLCAYPWIIKVSS